MLVYIISLLYSSAIANLNCIFRSSEIPRISVHKDYIYVYAFDLIGEVKWFTSTSGYWILQNMELLIQYVDVYWQYEVYLVMKGVKSEWGFCQKVIDKMKLSMLFVWFGLNWLAFCDLDHFYQ